jgi:heptosyltransferase-3
MARIKRVLLYRLGSLGDTVVALPSFHLVARAFPEAERRLLTNFPVLTKAPPAAAILEGSGTVHGYFRYSTGTRSFLELARLWWRIVRWRPQVLVYLGPARGVESAMRDARFFRVCGIRRLVGVPVTEDMQANRWETVASRGGMRILAEGSGVGSALEDDGWEEPEAARLARNLAQLGDARLDDPASWNLRLTEAERGRAAEVMDGLGAGSDGGGRRAIAVCVGTKVQSKDWGRENWRSLLARLAELYPGYALVLLGAGDELEASEFAGEGWREAVARRAAAGPVEAGIGDAGPLVNLCGALTPRESAAVLARAVVFVGHDSGPMHLAAAVQTPCVAIFAARNKPRAWFPYGAGHRVVYHRVDCWGCGLETCVVEKKKCLTSIAVEEVVAQVRAVLG